MGSCVPPTHVSQRGGGYFFAAIYGLLPSYAESHGLSDRG